MFYPSLKEKVNVLDKFYPVYEIVPSPLYGWNFKCIESRHVIKYSKGQSELIDYAHAYCRTHPSELRIFNRFNEMEKVLKFENDNVIKSKET